MARVPAEAAAKELRAAGAEPLEPYKNAHTPWRATCLSCGQEVAPRLSKIRSGQSPCRSCALKAAGAAKRAAHETTALAAMDAAGLDPLEPYPGALKPWRCTCRACGREVAPRYAMIQQGGGGCGYCSGRRVDPAEVAARMVAAGVQPKVPYPGSGVPWLCMCLTCGRDVSPMYGSIVSGQSACKFCARRAIHEDDAVEQLRNAGFEPLSPYPGTKTPWPSRCLRCGSSAQPRLNHVMNGGRGCSQCAGNTPATAEDALFEFKAAGYEPTGPFSGGVDSPWPATCTECGNHVTPTLKAVRKGARCVYCTGTKVEPGAARDLMLQFDLEPLEPYPGSHTPWRCTCLRCGRTVQPRYHHVASRGTICRYCGKRGPDMTAESTLYLLKHDTLRALKVGVSRRSSARLRQHRERGWNIIKTWNISTGADAYRIEAQILTWLRDTLQLPPYLSAVEMPQGGWTETVGLDSVSVPELATVVEQALKSE